MIALPTAFDLTSLADWLELELLFGPRERLTQTELLGLLSDDFGVADSWEIPYVDEDLPHVPVEDEDALQVRIEETWMVLEERIRRAGAKYPLIVEGAAVSVSGTWRENLEYAFMALLNARQLFGLAAQIDAAEPAILFEKLVKTALANYLGGKAARFGWPLDEEFTGSIADRVEDLARRMGERPQRELVTVSTDGKDHGLDVAAWAPFDHRGCKVVVLCQCGIGADFDQKTLPSTRWPQLIRFVAQPLTALAVPFEDFGRANAEVKWESLATDAGLLLDRTRIAKFARAEDEEGLPERIVDWVETTVPLFQVS